MTRILVTGGSGQLGKCFNHIKKDYPKILFHFLDIDKLDITDYDSTLIYFKNKILNLLLTVLHIHKLIWPRMNLIKQK